MKKIVQTWKQVLEQKWSKMKFIFLGQKEKKSQAKKNPLDRLKSTWGQFRLWLEASDIKPLVLKHSAFSVGPWGQSYEVSMATDL